MKIPARIRAEKNDLLRLELFHNLLHHLIDGFLWNALAFVNRRDFYSSHLEIIIQPLSPRLNRTGRQNLHRPIPLTVLRAGFPLDYSAAGPGPGKPGDLVFGSDEAVENVDTEGDCRIGINPSLSSWKLASLRNESALADFHPEGGF